MYPIHGKAEFTASLLQITSVSHDLLEIILKCLFGNIYYYWLYSVYIVLYRHIFLQKNSMKLKCFVEVLSDCNNQLKLLYVFCTESYVNNNIFWMHTHLMSNMCLVPQIGDCTQQSCAQAPEWPQGSHSGPFGLAAQWHTSSELT